MGILAELYNYCNKKVRGQPRKFRKAISSASSYEILNTLTSNMDVVVEDTDDKKVGGFFFLPFWILDLVCLFAFDMLFGAIIKVLACF